MALFLKHLEPSLKIMIPFPLTRSLTITIFRYSNYHCKVKLIVCIHNFINRIHTLR